MTSASPKGGANGGRIIVGLLFIALGAAFLLDRLGVWTVDPSIVWPVVLIGVGAAMLVGALVRRSRAGG